MLGNPINEELKSSKEFEININNGKHKKRESNTSSNYKPISDPLFDNKSNYTKINLKNNKNNLKIESLNSINPERENLNNLTKNYWNNGNQIFSKNSPLLHNRPIGSSSRKIGFSETNNNNFSKIN